jgi:hypothetical protein
MDATRDVSSPNAAYVYAYARVYTCMLLGDDKEMLETAEHARDLQCDPVLRKWLPIPLPSDVRLSESPLSSPEPFVYQLVYRDERPPDWWTS